MKKAFFPFLIVSIVLCSCATRIAGLKQSESFVYSNVLSGKVGVGGVTSVMENLEDGRKSALANLLRTELLEERKEYNVVPSGTLAAKIGKAKYGQVMESYKAEGVLTDESLALLKPAATVSRYVAFARIENDNVSNGRSEIPDRNEKGEAIPNSGRISTSTKRTMTASLNIYDLQNGDVAWSGSVTKSATNTQEYDRQHEMQLVSVIKAFKGEARESDAEKYPYPSAPEANKVLAKIFAGFAENMPKKP